MQGIERLKSRPGPQAGSAPETRKEYLGEKTSMNVTKTKASRSARPRSGRPTKEQAGQITGHIVEVATKLFLESSFESISVDLIAATARISKQTFYARFASKEELYAAVIRRSVDNLLMPAAGEPDRAGPIETTLIRIGVELSRRAIAPALRLA